MSKECQDCTEEEYCEPCFKREAAIQEALYKKDARKHAQFLAHEKSEDCGEESCQTCCTHSDERDHGICIDCGHEEDPGEAIDRAMDALDR